MSKKVATFKCYNSDCPRVFTTARGRASHQRMHKPVYVPPPPVTRTERIAPSLLESHSLLNGKHLELGDVFYRVEKHVIKSITYTEGTNTVRVESEKIKSNWQVDRPN